MANDLQTTETRAVDPTKLTTPLITSALSDSSYLIEGTRWKPEWAKRVFEREGVDWFKLRDATRAALAPPMGRWLIDRLRLLWKSSTPAGSLDATAWLHETTRLLSDQPQSVLAWAIDQAVKTSERGFMPSVGEIRKLAEPKTAELRRNLQRLEAMCSETRALPSKTKHVIPEEDRCTPEEAEQIRKALGIRYDDDSRQRENYIPVEQRRAPTREDYIRMGVDPATLDER